MSSEDDNVVDSDFCTGDEIHPMDNTKSNGGQNEKTQSENVTVNSDTICSYCYQFENYTLLTLD